MTFNPQKTRHWHSADIRQTYTSRDTILYALGVGLGRSPLDEAELRFVYERRTLTALPTFATVLASPGAWMRDEKELGIDFLKLVHGEQHVTLHGELPVAGTVVGRSRVVRLVDKGEGKGAVMHVEKQLFDDSNGELLATTENVLFLRGNGGFSATYPGDEPSVPLAPTPETPADLIVDVVTRSDQAVLYRLSGDLNPLHIDPQVAAGAGFARPVLHGLATYGIACGAITLVFGSGPRPEALKTLRARLSSPVYPGETIQMDFWKTAGSVSFRGRVVERDVTVLSHGYAGF